MTLFLGVDVGSTTVKVVILDETGALHAHRYLRSAGRPRETLLRAIAELSGEVDLAGLGAVGFTGSGGEAVAAIVGGRHVNELVSQTRAVGEYYRTARTVIEIGGQDSKMLSVAWDDAAGQMTLLDFSMNTLCAAGTGSFLDQQAERLGISIENEFERIALASTAPARIAGRCTVFAKSDMIHLQQRGVPLGDILAGLCQALARNFRSVIGRGKAFTPPILLQGGVAFNRAVARAFREVLGVAEGELVVPPHHWLMPAIGTGLSARDDWRSGCAVPFVGFSALDEAVRTTPPPRTDLVPLKRGARRPRSRAETLRVNGYPVPVYLGIDVGSISTNVVLLDDDLRVVARKYLMTAGRPLDAVRQALAEIGRDCGPQVEVRAVGTTGSGRYLTSDFAGGDTVRNEITAQARAAVAFDPAVDTIIEIGGQDSKFIRLLNGAVIDFAMNNACAAGTGSFLEEQADRLRIDIAREFADRAFDSQCPVSLGERCTVFMESDLVHHQQRGAKVNDLTAGLAFSIAHNYLNRVVCGRPLGQRVFFQGGVAWNQAVVAAFEQVTGRPITVPPHHDVTGAIGAAILAREDARRHPEQRTRFRGFDLHARQYETSSFECRACPNLCEVSRIVLEGEPPIFYGARCDRFEEAGRGAKSNGHLPDLFAERNALLLGHQQDSQERERGAQASHNGRSRNVSLRSLRSLRFSTTKPAPRPVIAMPRSLVVYDMYPFWREFLTVLGADVVLSDETNPQTVKLAQENAAIETCFPVKLALGHALTLRSLGADALLLPSVVNREEPAEGQRQAQYCPYVPAAAQLVSARLAEQATEMRSITLPVHLLWRRVARKDLTRIARALGLPAGRVGRAADAAWSAQRGFYARLRARGRDVLKSLNGTPAVVVVGRPYNTNDMGACLGLPEKLRKFGVHALPMDFLPLEAVRLPSRYDNMFWRSGQDILRAGTIVANDPRLHAVYLTNFACGPDSFIMSFFRSVMGGKPFLELEVDEHTADAGVLTRVEAFLDSVNLRRTEVRS